MRLTNTDKAFLLSGLVVALGLGACSDDTTTPAIDASTPTADAPRTADAGPTSTPDAAPAPVDAAPALPDANGNATAVLESKVDTIVVIYAENRGFDNIYGTFPGANGIPGKNPTSSGTIAKQVDRDGTTMLDSLPRAWSGVTAIGQTPQIPPEQTTDKPNTMFSMEDTYGVDYEQITMDLVHRFYENQMQINGGKNDSYAAFSDSGGLSMGYYDGSRMALWDVAKDNVLADNFFQAVFGGSFLNHQYLICGCAPVWPDADTDPAHPSITALDMDVDGKFLPRLILNGAPTATEAKPAYVNSGTLTPKDYLGDGLFHGVNTLQPPYQPSGNSFAADDATKKYADRSKPNTLPPQTATTIGDQLDGANVSWGWYTGSYNLVLAHATGDRQFGSSDPGAAPDFQFHHHPFNFYAKFDPVTAADYRAAHLKDYEDLVNQANAGTLPHVVFYKPQGNYNQHPGYASIAEGDQHIASLIAKLQTSPQYAKMVIIVTYDENGGWYDHVVPPKGDKLGPGTRIPAIIVSELAKKGTVDHTQYDTASILRLIERRFGLAKLPGLAARDAALVANGLPAMGDLTNALDLR